MTDNLLETVKVRRFLVKRKSVTFETRTRKSRPGVGEYDQF